MHFCHAFRISGSNYYSTCDHLSAVREITDGSGTIQSKYEYDPYEEPVQHRGTFTSDSQYAGYTEHTANGLNVPSQRGYNPITSRWISRDPIGEYGGINLYGYVGNNPVYWVDPTGLFWMQIGAGIGGERRQGSHLNMQQYLDIDPNSVLRL